IGGVLSCVALWIKKIRGQGRHFARHTTIQPYVAIADPTIRLRSFPGARRKRAVRQFTRPRQGISASSSSPSEHVFRSVGDDQRNSNARALAMPKSMNQ
ncbi:AAEL006215-PA, partial [Aedes aegypti]